MEFTTSENMRGHLSLQSAGSCLALRPSKLQTCKNSFSESLLKYFLRKLDKSFDQVSFYQKKSIPSLAVRAPTSRPRVISSVLDLGLRGEGLGYI